jgi:hypothetical protein
MPKGARGESGQSGNGSIDSSRRPLNSVQHIEVVMLRGAFTTRAVRHLALFGI